MQDAAQAGATTDNEFGGYQWASAYLNIPKSTLYALVHEQRIPHIRLGPRFIRFSKSDLDSWLNEHKRPGR